MRKWMIVVAVALFAFPACSSQPKTEDDKALYALGVQIQKQLAVFDLSADELKMVQQGMKDSAAGKKLEADPEIQMQNIAALAEARMAKATEKQKALSKAFVEKAAAEPGAVKAPSGMIYQEISAGTGVQPTAANIVTVHYTGTLVDGKEFDSSVKRGEPAEFPLGQVIPCWTEGVGMMKVGGKAKLVCPSETAYGDRGRPPVIPGGATLIFEVELLDVQDMNAPKPKAKK
jgi:FKBP-type peptidyl-prolyl cis-trans isomerase FkpA